MFHIRMLYFQDTDIILFSIILPIYNWICPCRQPAYYMFCPKLLPNYIIFKKEQIKKLKCEIFHSTLVARGSLNKKYEEGIVFFLVTGTKISITSDMVLVFAFVFDAFYL